MNRLKNKAYKNFLTIILAIIALAAILLMIFGDRIRYRIYQGDRIVAYLDIRSDGRLTKTEDLSFINCDHIENKGETIVIGKKAGEYGKYSMGISDKNSGKIINFDVIQYNWWNVVNFHLDIDTEPNSGVTSISGYYTTLSESGRKEKRTIDKKYGSDEKIITIRVGP